MKTIDDFTVAGQRVLVRDDLTPETGGGASLEFIRGKVPPGLAVLDQP